jgi:outer membrane protein assembly factor BamB/predicted MPP superfamily phosphohydrolase
MNRFFYKILFLTCLVSFLVVEQGYSQAKNFQFAWLSDIHIERGSSHNEDLQNSVDDINSRPEIQFAILTGDITDFGFGVDLNIAKSILDKLKKPYYIVPGNHDTKWSESGNTAFQDIFGHRNISFNFGNIQFIGYQTGPVLHRGDGYIQPRDLAWVAKELAAAKAKGRIVIPFTHYPLNETMSNWYKLTDLFRQYGVPLALAGHIHANQKLNFDGVAGVVGRTNQSYKSAQSNYPGGYNIVNVAKDSIYFSESNPETKKVTLWHKLPLRSISYPSQPIHKPDLSVNGLYPQVTTKWKLSLPGGISSSPAFNANAVFIGDRDGGFYAFSRKNGKKMWAYHAGKSIFSTPTIAGDHLIFGSADGFIYCISTKNGSLYWKFKTENWVLASAAIEGNTAFIGASDGKFRAININTGKLVWEYADVKGWIQTKPLVYQGKVFFGAWDNNFYALDLQTGKPLWNWARTAKELYPGAFYAPAAAWPVGSNGRVFIAGPDMALTAFDAEKGKVIWRVSKPRLNEAVGISEDGAAIFVKCTFDSTLMAYSAIAKTPEIIWKTVVNYGMDDNESAISEKGGTVVFTFRNGLAIAVDSKTGRILWKHKLGDVMQNAATLIDAKTVLLSDVDGKLEYISTH